MPATRQKLRVTSALDDLPLVHDQNLVRIHDRRQTMGNHERRASLRDAIEFGLDRLFGFRIECRSRFVEDQDGGILQQRTCDGHALFFAAREFQPAFADFGVVAVRQSDDQRMDMRRARGLFDFVAGRVRTAVQNVVVDGVVKQHGVLRNDRDRIAQRRLGVVAHIAQQAVGRLDRDASGIDVVEAVQQARERGLSRAGVADHGDGAAARHFEADPAQDVAARIVAEAHVFEHHFRPVRVQRDCIIAVAHVHAFVEKTEQSLQIGEGLLDLAIHHAQQIQRRGKLQQHGVHEHQTTEGHGALDHAGGGAPHHRGDAQRDDGDLAQIEQAEGLAAHHLRFLALLQADVVAPRFVFFVAEIFDCLVVEQRIDRALVGAGVGFDRSAVVARAPFGHHEGVRHVRSERHQRDHRKAPVVHPHQHTGDQRNLEQRGQDGVDHPVEQIGDGGTAAFDIARDAAGATGQMETQR